MGQYCVWANMEVTWKDQRTPTLAIVARGNQIRPVKPGQFSVFSQSEPGKTYTIVLAGDKWACTCPFFAQGATRDCIHTLACRFRSDIRSALVDVEERPSCDRCKSVSVVSNGKRHNDSGAITRWLCKECGRKFTGRDGYHKRRSDARTIALALDLYFRGLSLAKVADHFKQAQGLSVDRSTIYRWVVHYSGIAAEWMDAQGAMTGKRWHMDETVVNVNGEHRYLWNILDADTRFLLATHVSENRSMENTRAPIKKAKAVASQAPSEVFTDGMRAYPTAIAKEFPNRHAANDERSPHRRVPSIRAKTSNNMVERLHGSEKERTKIMRGFDNDAGTAALAEGWRVHYNLARTHSTLGTTPGEAAGLPPLEGLKWEAILKQATGQP